MTEQPVFTPGSDRYVFVWEKASTEIALERIREGRNDEIRGEITVRHNPQGTIHKAHINLLADRTVKSLADSLAKRVSGNDWYSMLLQVVEASIQHFRSGSPLIDLSELDNPSDDGQPDWLLKPYLVDGPNVFFALGGAGKGYLACAFCATLTTGIPILGHKPERTGPVAYIDFEATQNTTHKRLARVVRSLGGDFGQVFYKRPRSSLIQIADDLANDFADRGIICAILDSLGMARGGAPESAEDTIHLFAAIAKLGVPTVCIDHVSKSASNGDGPDMPIGSVYTQNSARNVWSIRSDSRPAEIHMFLRNTKINDGPRTKDQRLRIAFENDRVDFLLSSAPPPRQGTLWEQMVEYLTERGSATVIELARYTEKSDGHIRKELHRHRDRGECAQIGDFDLWQLTELLPDPL